MSTPNYAYLDDNDELGLTLGMLNDYAVRLKFRYGFRPNINVERKILYFADSFLGVDFRMIKIPDHLLTCTNESKIIKMIEIVKLLCSRSASDGALGYVRESNRRVKALEQFLVEMRKRQENKSLQDIATQYSIEAEMRKRQENKPLQEIETQYSKSAPESILTLLNEEEKKELLPQLKTLNEQVKAVKETEDKYKIAAPALLQEIVIAGNEALENVAVQKQANLSQIKKTDLEKKSSAIKDLLKICEANRSTPVNGLEKLKEKCEESNVLEILDKKYDSRLMKALKAVGRFFATPLPKLHKYIENRFFTSATQKLSQKLSSNLQLNNKAQPKAQETDKSSNSNKPT